MAQAIRHPGFAVVDILQPCVSFNHLNTYGWYRERVIPVVGLPGYDPTNRQQALSLCSLEGEEIPVGVFFREVRPTFEDSLPQLAEGPLSRRSIEDIRVIELMKEMV
jgi:2-oxoglutarate ferredoxin oxidoreductase subunit beta